MTERKDLIPIDDRIIDIIFNGTDAVITRSEAKNKMKHLLILLTKTQRLNVLKKASVCEYFIKQKNNNQEKSKINGRICRKFDINRQHLNNYCEICESLRNQIK